MSKTRRLSQKADEATAMLLPLLLAAAEVTTEAQRLKLWEAATGAAYHSFCGLSPESRETAIKLRDLAMEKSRELMGDPE